MERRQQRERRWVKRTDWIWIGALAGLCALALFFFWLFSQGEGTLVAEISYNGALVRQIPLETAEDACFVLPENTKVGFQIENRRIRFYETDCPDKLCENAGFLDSPNQLAVCLPNRVSLRIVARQTGQPDEGVDIIVN